MTGVTNISVAGNQAASIKLPIAVKGGTAKVPSTCATCVVKDCQSQRR